MRFAGLDMLGPNTHTCQYGGFFILKLGAVFPEPWFVFCGNIAKDFTISFLRDLQHNFGRSQYKLIFASFAGYSSGAVDAIYRFSKCDDLHFEYIGCENRGFKKTYLKNGKRRPNKIHLPKVPICFEIWIYHNIGFKQSKTISNCEIRVDYAEIPSRLSQHFHGAFQATIYNWVVFSTFVPSLQKALRYHYLNLDILAINDFPSHMTDDQNYVLVMFNDKKDLNFQHFKVLQIRTNNSMNDLNMQIIKLQMYQFLVCSSFEQEYFIGKNIHMIGIDDKFYRLHKNMQSSNHIGPYCNIQVNGSMVALKVDYWPRELNSFYAHPQHKIIIGILHTTYCPSICTLDIKVLESDLNTNKVHAYIWNNVSDIEWYILQKDRGFSLHIRSHLSTHFCIACGTLIKLKPLLPDVSRIDIPVLGLPKEKITGTWEEAAAYCRNKSARLATFNQQVEQNLLHEMSNRRKGTVGYIQPDAKAQLYYVGLHKTTQV